MKMYAKSRKIKRKDRMIARAIAAFVPLVSVTVELVDDPEMLGLYEFTTQNS